MARKGYVASTFTYEGKRYYAYGKTQREADRAADKRLEELETNARRITGSTTVEEWSLKWLEDYKQGVVGQAWYDDMNSLIRNHIVPEIGPMRIRDVRPMHLTRLLNKHVDMSDSHMHKLIIVLKQIFDAAEENDLIGKDPAKRIKPPQKPEKHTYRTITDQERDLTLRTAEKYPEEGLFFLIMLFCGLRPQEVSRLQMSDYDKKNRTITVQRARKADGSTAGPKSAAGAREVPVPDYLADRLDRIHKKPAELIVTSEQGQPLTKTSQRRLWKKFKRKMDIENGAELFRRQVVESTLADDFVPYCYRHTYCTDLQDAGVPVTVAQKLMGHSSIKVTADIYTHHTQTSFEDARDKINEYVSKR